jgi:hypothetical protein
MFFAPVPKKISAPSLIFRDPGALHTPQASIGIKNAAGTDPAQAPETIRPSRLDPARMSAPGLFGPDPFPTLRRLLAPAGTR